MLSEAKHPLAPSWRELSAKLTEGVSPPKERDSGRAEVVAPHRMTWRMGASGRPRPTKYSSPLTGELSAQLTEGAAA